MKTIFFMLGLCLMSFQVLALSETVKFQFPQENGRYFLATTAEESAQKLDQSTKERRGQALCEHLGFKKATKVTSTFIAVDELKVNDLQSQKVVTRDLIKSHKHVYYNYHAVINDLECSSGEPESRTSYSSIFNGGREIAIEKGTRNHSKMRFRSASEQ